MENTSKKHAKTTQKQASTSKHEQTRAKTIKGADQANMQATRRKTTESTSKKHAKATQKRASTSKHEQKQSKVLTCLH